MNRYITLLNKQWNWEYIQIRYDVITEKISTSLYYPNKKYIQNNNKKYKQSEKGIKVQKKYGKKYRQSHKEQLQKYRDEHKKETKKYNKKYAQSEKGIKLRKKHQAKRKRNLQWILMFKNPFNKNVKVDYHHINDTYVVAIPRNLHKLYLGKYHKEKVMNIVKQIYLQGD